ncbi:hypothetical protein ROHU_000126 [Labeo rohita]|uniref:Integrase core domain-containing protein n=1 Tax=Labeo rohita TaxID=84645 RepID=A0A498P5G7_LABRO|nr:hypothetical protein ROHU_000126 [Labeo rohita]
MNDVGLSVSGLYSSITDEELENTVRNIKDDVSAAGHRRIERLWRDVRITVTNKYSHMLHSLEAEGLLDLSVVEELFCVHYTFLPRLQADLDTFAEVTRTLKSQTWIGTQQLLMMPVKTWELLFQNLNESRWIEALEHLLNSTGANVPVKELDLLCREFVSTNLS